MDLDAHSSDDSDTLDLKRSAARHQSRAAKAEADIAKALMTAAKADAAADLLEIKMRKRAQRSGKPLPARRPLTPPQQKPKPLEAHFSSPRVFGGRSAGGVVQVPVSPSPQRVRPPVSPVRDILGIGKGLTARHVSLKPSPQKPIKTFNERSLDRIRDSKAVSDKAVAKEASRATSFTNLVPAFSATATGKLADDVYQEPVGNFMIRDPVIAKEDADRLSDNVAHRFNIRQFFAAVGPPDYELDDDIVDFVIAGIVASKSDTRSAKNENASKYCVLTLTDLKLDVAVFLYDDAFKDFWKMPVGTVLYLLNPVIQKPRPGASADKLTFKITDAKKILEVAKAADFGLCRTVKQNGQQCTQWINTRKQAEGVCDFHLELKFEKNTKKRTEFSSGTRAFDPRQPTKKRRKEMENHAQHRVFFGDNVTAMSGGHGLDEQYDQPVKNDARLMKEAEERQRDRQAVAKLMKNIPSSAGNAYFDLEKEQGAEASDEEKPTVFSAPTIRKLGFDPTRRAYITAVQHTKPIADLAAELTKDGDDIDLTVKRNAGSSKFIVAGIEADKKAVSNNSSSTLPVQDEDSDSDLEIVR
ncbi:hypothetical protein BCR37DRAFT_153512 [Protomyces lactucae-debilis]|uniref:Uncharacterized protein n=1 Tax=Protomyces lactucae-debilis TaxID=2754530 RepID=A0A1Y2F1X8_PROLT|nr:uncharacterized protein BCR37DRAFT_153512 [Protomyces lactucae-debilis]ORY77356.1 hypothetical protein BCR37DRAFT_153512 [Protomyces lactucae-debilis]